MVNSTPVINKAMLKKRTKLPMKRVDGHTPKMFAILYDNKRSFTDKLKNIVVFSNYYLIFIW
jgi:hypothetical protein